MPRLLSQLCSFYYAYNATKHNGDSMVIEFDIHIFNLTFLKHYAWIIK